MNYKTSFLFIGFGSTISQILLIREFLASFYGNELSIGIIFACWLFWIGVGTFVGNHLNQNQKNTTRLLSILLIFSMFMTFLQIIAIKFCRLILNISVGEYSTLPELFIFAFSALSIGCMLWGLLFTLSSKIDQHDRVNKWRGVNIVYIYETMGSVLGGLFFSLVLVNIYITMEIILLLIIFSLFILSFNKRYLSSSFSRKLVLIVILFLITIFIFYPGAIFHFEDMLNKSAWLKINDKLTYIKSKNTKYQNLSLLKIEDQYTIYSDGKPTYNIPNTYNTEIFIHLILIQSNNPSNVLIIGGGFNGLITEVLKYDVNLIDYVEIDPDILSFIQPYLNNKDKEILYNSKIHIIEGDGRKYISTTDKKYDVIIINCGEPSTAGMNRFFTYDFYKECYNKMNQNGILAFPFTSSSDYLGEELKNLNGSMYWTTKKVFQNLTVIPSTTAIMIGKKGDSPFLLNTDSLFNRYVNRQIKSTYFSEYLYEQLMPPDRRDFFISTMESVSDPKINYDIKPITYFFEMILWNKFLKGDSKIFDELDNIYIYLIPLLIFLLFYITWLLFMRKSKTRIRISMLMVIFMTGFVSMMFSLLIMLNFQTVFGSIYELVGAMIATNMLGLSLGAFFASQIRNEQRIKLILTFILIGGIILSILLPIIMEVLMNFKIVILYFIVMILYGLITGSIFSFTNRIYLNYSDKVGNVYAYDVLGSSIGALVSCSVILPILGIHGSALFLAAILGFAVLIIFVNFVFMKEIR